MNYEYGFLVQTGTLTAGLADASSEEMGRGFAQLFGPLAERVSNAIRAYPNGPWEIVSHDITRIDRHLVVTFLIRRQSR